MSAPDPSDPTQRFSSRAKDYRKGRPGYPAELVPLIQSESGLGGDLHAADIGAGTGLFTDRLLEHCAQVSAVEPNPEMAAILQADLGDRDALHVLQNTAESTGLPDSCVQLITSAQAFHWFDPEPTLQEFRRIAAPGGWLALIWNSRMADADDFHREFEDLLLTQGAYQQTRHRGHSGNELEELLGVSVSQHSLTNQQHLNREGFHQRVFSSSYTPQPDSDGYDAFRARCEELFSQFSSEGQITIRYSCQCYLARIG